MVDTNRSIAKSVALKAAAHLMEDQFDINGDLSAQSEKVIIVSNKLFDWLCEGTITAAVAAFDVEEKKPYNESNQQLKASEPAVTSTELKCPECGSDVWDNRHKPKQGFPILKCKATAAECKGEGAQWPWSVFEEEEVSKLVNKTKKETSYDAPF
tara:strand:- start:200 stop:664 length:465 start_codon:yes stop_codon:yes gene_type:complete